MSLIASPTFLKTLKKKAGKKQSLKIKINKQLKLLEENPRHPSLRLHKLTGKRRQQYSIWVEANLRITFVKYGKDLYLTNLITHDEY